MKRLFLALLALAAVPVPMGETLAGESRSMSFPVEGQVSFRDDFGAPRSGGRAHQGNDIFGPKMRPILATSNAVVTFMRSDSGGTAGNMVTITDAEGWQYRYMHLNNDTPGTDDGSNHFSWAFAEGMRTGSRVLSGQLIGYVGDSGNAEGTAPHVHFEIIRPDGTVLDPYESLLYARRDKRPIGRAVAASPRGGYYVLSADGGVHPFDGAPWFGSPSWSWPIARSIAVMPDGLGYVVLDGHGGLHRYGSAADMGQLELPYWNGWDIARAVVITPSGRGVAVMDAWGGIHGAGDAPRLAGSYWPGWDIARGLAITPTGQGYYQLDGLGGVHTAGDAESFTPLPYWPTWDIARSIVATETGIAVLDGFGGIHIAGTMPVPTDGGWAPSDRWEGLALRGTRYHGVRDDGLSQRWPAVIPPSPPLSP